MKTILPPPKRKYLGRSGFWLLLFFAINLTFFSCVTEESPSTDMVNEVETDQAVEDARAWFGPQEEFEIPPKNGINSKGKTQTKKVFWDDYMIHKGGAVIELKVSYNFHTVPITGEKTALELAEKAEKVFHRLIIEKDDKGEYVKYLLKYFPKNDTDASQANLETNNFQGVDAWYSGEIQLLTWEEELLKGWTIAEGEITRAYFPRRTSQKPVSDVQAALNCQPSYIEICEVNPVGSGSGVRINVDLPEVVVEPHCYDIISYDPNCSPDTGSGGPGTYTNPTGPGGGGGGSSPGTGGSTPVLDDEQLWQQYIDGIIDPELKRQAQLDYLENHGGAEFVELINELMASGVDHYDVMEINKLVNGVYLEQKGRFIMAIFSPENVGTILTFALTNPNLSSITRNKTFQLFSRYATEGKNIVYKSFSSSNFRANLTLKTGMNPANAQEHHVFPQTSEFSSFFAGKGINVHNPVYGAWWSTTSHQANAYAYNMAWRNWIALNQGASQAQIIAFARQLMSQYGIAVLI